MAEQNPRTVFILGAGASYDFGFPTGEELLVDINEVIKELLGAINAYVIHVYRNSFSMLDKATPNKVATLRELRGVIELFEHVAEGTRTLGPLKDNLFRLQRGIPLAKSIDNFLHDNRADVDLVRLGKTVIAIALLKAERHGLAKVGHDPRRNFIPLYREGQVDGQTKQIPPDFFELRKSWFVTFFRELRADNGRDPNDTGFEAFKTRLRQIGIITFNYERSLEFLFRQAIEAYEGGLNEEQKRELIDIFEGQIIHPYGRLASLDDMSFAKEISGDIDWSSFATNLQIFTEQGQDGERARQWMQNAQRAVFLGFGFHEQNMEYLGLPDDPRDPVFDNIFATAYGESEFRGERIFHRLRRRAQGSLSRNAKKREIDAQGQNTFVLNATAKDLLQEFSDLIFQ